MQGSARENQGSVSVNKGSPKKGSRGVYVRGPDHGKS
jgi:hypothetical protein